MIRKISVLTIIAVAAVLFGMVNPRSVDTRIVTNVPPDISGEQLQAIVIEDFEKSEVAEEGWQIESTPKQYEKEETAEKLKRKNPVPILEMKMVEGGPNSMKPEEFSVTGLGKEKTKVLGVHFRFRYPGNNSVHILAPMELQWDTRQPVDTFNPRTGQEERERGLQLPGQARAISVWVHGRGHPYDLEVWVKDYRGQTHILKFGSVNFVGWRPLKVYIPTSIPQSFESYPQTRVAKITRFVLRAQVNVNKEELITDGYFFFDQVKSLSDTYEVNFDGSELHKNFKKDQGGGNNQPQQ